MFLSNITAERAESGISRNTLTRYVAGFLVIQGQYALSDRSLQIYRKAALKVVQELGEETFPEPQVAEATSAASTTSETTSESPETATPASETENTDSAPSSTASSETSSESTSSTPPTSPADTTPNPSEDSPKTVTTKKRKPLPIPDSVHVRITPETLKDYVGPPVYQKDRMYVTPPPPGVSTGLGYLGNGSGAVMPIEAMVSISVGVVGFQGLH
jgi:Lon-like ATP-dependent protease